MMNSFTNKQIQTIIRSVRHNDVYKHTRVYAHVNYIRKGDISKYIERNALELALNKELIV